MKGKKISQIALILVAYVLVMANAPMPGYFVATRTTLQEGNIPIRIDPRLYEDKVFEVTLPAGKYSRVNLSRKANGAMQLLSTVAEGDPRLLGNPVRLQFPLVELMASAESPEDKAHETGVPPAGPPDGKGPAAPEAQLDRDLRHDEMFERTLAGEYTITAEEISGRRGMLTFHLEKVYEE